MRLPVRPLLKFLAASILVAVGGITHAAELPKTIESAPCTKPPTIDGVLSGDEWKQAPEFKFDMPMFQWSPLAPKGTRPCELRIMNSANALYILLRIPDAEVHKSLNPLEIDLATLAFCRGKEVSKGDDRKVLAPGFYVDKHVTEPGKDADDTRQDGRGAVAHDAGVYTFEWAIPLDSKDTEDLQAKPGDEFRFNIAYFDRFRFDFKESQVGAMFAADLNKLAGWGTLKLASDVTNDGGGAFRGPDWLTAAFGDLAASKPPVNQLKIASANLVNGGALAIGKIEVNYTYLDPRGASTPAKAKIYLPAAVQNKGRVPLIYAAGYEQDDGSAAHWVQRGYAVATPAGLGTLPLTRTSNPDTALLHIVRSLPFVDDARVVVTGGSAGGWMSFLLAAETFPLAGVGPDVAPMNWGYNAAYLINQKDKLTSAVPALMVIRPLLEPNLAVYGKDTSDETWYRNSPLAHVPTITCPVSTFWTTADVLVPINQIGTEWVQPFDAAAFPPGITMDPAKLTTSKVGQMRLTDVLPENAREVFIVRMPEGAVKKTESVAPDKQKVIELPVSRDKQWSITILDEGPPEPKVDHLKYNLRWTRDAFIKQVLETPIAKEQLTPTKLERLMDRYSGREWLPSPVKHLDRSDSEQADVLRGLRTYVSVSPEHARTFAELYGKLPSNRQVLPADIVEQLQSPK